MVEENYDLHGNILLALKRRMSLKSLIRLKESYVDENDEIGQQLANQVSEAKELLEMVGAVLDQVTSYSYQQLIQLTWLPNYPKIKDDKITQCQQLIGDIVLWNYSALELLERIFTEFGSLAKMYYSCDDDNIKFVDTKAGFIGVECSWDPFDSSSNCGSSEGAMLLSVDGIHVLGRDSSYVLNVLINNPNVNRRSRKFDLVIVKLNKCEDLKDCGLFAYNLPQVKENAAKLLYEAKCRFPQNIPGMNMLKEICRTILRLENEMPVTSTSLKQFLCWKKEILNARSNKPEFLQANQTQVSESSSSSVPDIPLSTDRNMNLKNFDSGPTKSRLGTSVQKNNSHRHSGKGMLPNSMREQLVPLLNTQSTYIHDVPSMVSNLISAFHRREMVWLKNSTKMVTWMVTKIHDALRKNGDVSEPNAGVHSFEISRTLLNKYVKEAERSFVDYTVTNKAFVRHVRTLSTNLSLVNNESLRKNVIGGVLSMDKLVSMDSMDLAPEAMKKFRKERDEKHLREDVLIVDDNSTYEKKTKEGGLEIVQPVVPPFLPISIEQEQLKKKLDVELETEKANEKKRKNDEDLKKREEEKLIKEKSEKIKWRKEFEKQTIEDEKGQFNKNNEKQRMSKKDNVMSLSSYKKSQVSLEKKIPRLIDEANGKKKVKKTFCFKEGNDLTSEKFFMANSTLTSLDSINRKKERFSIVKLSNSKMNKHPLQPILSTKNPVKLPEVSQVIQEHVSRMSFDDEAAKNKYINKLLSTEGKGRLYNANQANLANQRLLQQENQKKIPRDAIELSRQQKTEEQLKKKNDEEHQLRQKQQQHEYHRETENRNETVQWKAKEAQLLQQAQEHHQTQHDAEIVNHKEIRTAKKQIQQPKEEKEIDDMSRSIKENIVFVEQLLLNKGVVVIDALEKLLVKIKTLSHRITVGKLSYPVAATTPPLAVEVHVRALSSNSKELHVTSHFGPIVEECCTSTTNSSSVTECCVSSVTKVYNSFQSLQNKWTLAISSFLKECSLETMVSSIYERQKTFKVLVSHGDRFHLKVLKQPKDKLQTKILFSMLDITIAQSSSGYCSYEDAKNLLIPCVTNLLYQFALSVVNANLQPKIKNSEQLQVKNEKNGSLSNEGIEKDGMTGEEKEVGETKESDKCNVVETELLYNPPATVENGQIIEHKLRKIVIKKRPPLKEQLPEDDLGMYKEMMSAIIKPSEENRFISLILEQVKGSLDDFFQSRPQLNKLAVLTVPLRPYRIELLLSISKSKSSNDFELCIEFLSGQVCETYGVSWDPSNNSWERQVRDGVSLMIQNQIQPILMKWKDAWLLLLSSFQKRLTVVTNHIQAANESRAKNLKTVYMHEKKTGYLFECQLVIANIIVARSFQTNEKLAKRYASEDFASLLDHFNALVGGNKKNSVTVKKQQNQIQKVDGSSSSEDDEDDYYDDDDEESIYPDVNLSSSTNKKNEEENAENVVDSGETISTKASAGLEKYDVELERDDSVACRFRAILRAVYVDLSLLHNQILMALKDTSDTLTLTSPTLKACNINVEIAANVTLNASLSQFLASDSGDLLKFQVQIDLNKDSRTDFSYEVNFDEQRKRIFQRDISTQWPKLMQESVTKFFQNILKHKIHYAWKPTLEFAHHTFLVGSHNMIACFNKLRNANYMQVITEVKSIPAGQWEGKVFFNEVLLCEAISTESEAKAKVKVQELTMRFFESVIDNKLTNEQERKRKEKEKEDSRLRNEEVKRLEHLREQEVLQKSRLEKEAKRKREKTKEQQIECEEKEDEDFIALPKYEPLDPINCNKKRKMNHESENNKSKRKNSCGCGEDGNCDDCNMNGANSKKKQKADETCKIVKKEIVWEGSMCLHERGNPTQKAMCNLSAIVIAPTSLCSDSKYSFNERFNLTCNLKMNSPVTLDKAFELLAVNPQYNVVLAFSCSNINNTNQFNNFRSQLSNFNHPTDRRKAQAILIRFDFERKREMLLFPPGTLNDENAHQFYERNENEEASVSFCRDQIYAILVRIDASHGPMDEENTLIKPESGLSFSQF